MFVTKERGILTRGQRGSKTGRLPKTGFWRDKRPIVFFGAVARQSYRPAMALYPKTRCRVATVFFEFLKGVALRDTKFRRRTSFAGRYLWRVTAWMITNRRDSRQESYSTQVFWSRAPATASPGTVAKI
jgi:hypothetical protein